MTEQTRPSNSGRKLARVGAWISMLASLAVISRFIDDYLDLGLIPSTIASIDPVLLLVFSVPAIIASSRWVTRIVRTKNGEVGSSLDKIDKVALSDLVEPGSCSIKDKIVVRKTVVGPGVILRGSRDEFVKCNWGGRSHPTLVQLELDADDYGFIRLEETCFVHCNFENVGVAVLPLIEDDFSS